MIADYYIEIIVFIVFISIVAIYLLTRKNNSTKPIHNIEANVEKEVEVEKEIQMPQEDPFDTIEEIIELEINNNLEDDITLATQFVQETYKNEEFNGTEEGTFGHGFEEISSVKEEKETKSITRREVPAHAKTTKDSFKEFAGTKILVAEDNLINQKVIRGLLDGSGIEITMADDGQETLDILENNSDFTMVLMDAHMPRVDGFEATRIIRANPNYNHIVVVALSGDTAADDIKKMIDAGMEKQLEKPLKMDALYNIIYTYTGEEKENIEDDNFIEIIMTKNLNGDKGLSVCAEDEDFYKEILVQFIKDYSDSPQHLLKYIKIKQNSTADRLLLDIIGITANIGAQRLNKTTHTLKNSLKNSDEAELLNIHKQYEADLTALLIDIKSYI